MIELNNSQLKEKFADAKNLKDLIGLIEAEAKSQAKVVCRFWLNGLSLSEVDEKKFYNTAIDDVNTLSFELQSTDELLTAVIGNWVSQLPIMVEINDSLSFIIKERGIEGHINDFVNLIDSCQLLVESLISINTLSPLNKVVQGDAWKANELLTKSSIKEALKAFESKDFVLLADVLEYDLGQALQTWAELLAATGSIAKEEIVVQASAGESRGTDGAGESGSSNSL